MKVVFVGPSLPDARMSAANDIDIRPPARQGDVMRALSDGATMIGIIDGEFALAAPVWHKEILFALSRNVTVLGAASMGALRAAECEAFGMIGIGTIFKDYVTGKRDDDADVALIYGPAEIGYPALSIPLVNVEATIDTISAGDLLAGECCEDLLQSARSIFFKNRTWKRIIDQAGLDARIIKPIVDSCWTDQKKLDAMALLQAMKLGMETPFVDDWQFNATPLFHKLYM